MPWLLMMFTFHRAQKPVSYTHLDVYKRQLWRSPANSSLVQGTDDKLRPRPNQYDRIPFPNEPAEQLASREVYVGYSNLLTAHRNHAEQYREMLLETRALRKKVDAHIRTNGQDGRGG